MEMQDTESTEHYWKALSEQMSIMSQCRCSADETNLEFIQVHALAIVQLCNQLMNHERTPDTSVFGSIHQLG